MTHSDARSERASGVHEARRLLTTRNLGRAIRFFGEVSSTNSLAAEWIDEGAPHGAVVVAEYQTHGRGRMGRSWLAAAGLNLTFSVVLRPDLPSDRLGMLTIAACAGIAHALDRFADPLSTAIKWPNDIYLNDRKLCGMLLEASWNAPGRKPAVVLGIGLNVNQDEFPAEIRDRATSLLIETGRIIPKAELLAALLSDLEKALMLLEENEDEVRKHYTDRMLSFNERIRLRFAATGRLVEGHVRGIDTSGGLIIESNSRCEVFHAGEVTRSV